MNFNTLSESDKLAVLRKYYAKFGDESAAYRVIKNPAQTQSVLNDIQSQINEQINKASRGVQNAYNFKKEGKTMDQATKDSLDFVNSLKNSISDYGQYLDSSVVDTYNGLAAEATKSGFSLPQLEGGSGTPISMKQITSEATGNGQQTASGNQRPMRHDFPNTAEGTKQFGAALNQYLAAEGRPRTLLTEPLFNRSTATGTTAGETAATTDTGTSETTSTGTTGAFATAQQSALDYIASSDLPGDLKAFYSEAVKQWDPNIELNAENIISTFKKIQTETIDPYFQGLANLAISSVERAVESTNKQRAIEKEQEEAAAKQAVTSAQAGLEASGLTFSGKGAEYLGKQSAFGENPIEQSSGFGSTIPEGYIPQQNRLIATSTEAKYQDTLKSLGQQAEEKLGSAKAAQLVGGYSPAGGVEGGLATEKSAKYGSTFGSLLNQQIGNVGQRENIEYSFNS